MYFESKYNELINDGRVRANHQDFGCVGPIHTVSPVLSPKSLEVNQSVQSLLLMAQKLGLTTSHRVPSLKYDMDASIATLFEGEVWGLC